MYILEIDNNIYNIARHPFYADIKGIDEYNLEAYNHSELIMMQYDISAKHEFETKELGFLGSNFWILVKISYYHLFNLIIKYSLPFVTTYLCERAFSDLIN